MASRRPFESSFTRRPGGGQPPVSLFDRDMDHFGGGGSSGGGGYEYEEDFITDQDQRQFTERIPRDAVGQRVRNDHGSRGGGAPGGWRQRSPEPRYRNLQEAGERLSRGPGAGGGGGQTLWGSEDSYGNNSHQQQQMQFDQQQQQQQQFEARQNVFAQAQMQIQNNAAAILRNPLGNSSLLGQPEPLVMVLPQSQTNSLMGNLGIQNPLGMFGQQVLLPNFNPSPFVQQQSMGTPFGQGVGEQQLSSIYGPQTQQPLSRFDSSRDDRSRSSRNDHSGGPRRSDSSRASGQHQNQRNDSSNNANRKRNLVLRDPRPEDNKRPRHSAGGGGGNNNRGGNGNNKRQSGAGGSGTGKVKRISLGNGDQKGNNNKNKNQRKSDGNKNAAAGGKAKATVSSETDSKKKEIVKEAGVKGDEKGKDENRSTKFDEVPVSLLVCKVCQKTMNDGASFESHLSGRAHVSLMKILEERFAKRAELLMTESKCAEDEIGIEKERQRRAGKSGRAEKSSNNYCKMCDCNYTINWGTHKVSLGHRVLKEFLHPTCRFCKTHFMHRIDWVSHMFTSTHLMKLQELKAEGSVPLDEQETPTQDELFAVYMNLSRDERPTQALSIKSVDGKESLTEEMKEILKNDRGEIELPAGEIPIPEKYEGPEGPPVGEEAIVEVSGSRCRVCRVYIPEDKNIEEHCKTKEHFHNYVSFLKRVMRYREHKEAERKAAEEKAKKDEEKKIQDEKNAKEKAAKNLANGEKEKEVKDKEKEETGMEVVEEDLAAGDAAGDGVVVLDEVDGEESQDGMEEQEEEETKKVETVEQESKAVKVEEPEVIAIDEDEEGGGGIEIQDTDTQEINEISEGGAEIEEGWPQIVSVEGNDKKEGEQEIEAATKVAAEEQNGDEEAEAGNESVEVPSVQEEVKEEVKVTSPTKVGRGGGIRGTTRGGAAGATPSFRGIPNRGGGQQTPSRGSVPFRGSSRGGTYRGTPGPAAMKNATARVDSNMRGGGQVGGGRGQTRGGRQGRGGSPRGGPRSGRGGSRGGPYR